MRDADGTTALGRKKTPAPRRRRGGVPLALLLLVLAGATSGCVGGMFSILNGQPYWVVPVRDDVIDANYLWGNLTWQSGKGHISWAADPDSEHPGGPALDAVGQAVAGNQYMVGSASKRLIGDDLDAMPAPDEFKGEALPQELHFNVTRHMQLDLLLTVDPVGSQEHTAQCLAFSAATGLGTGCPGECPHALDVQLYADDAWLGGAVAAHQSLPAATEVPAGFVLCRYRIPPEIASLAQGTVITLRIVHVSQDSHFQYGLEGEMRSQLRLAYYPAEEWGYRDPVANAEDQVPVIAQPSGKSVNSAESSNYWGAAGVGSVAFIAGFAARAAPNRRRVVLLTLLLLAASMSGCFGGSGPKPGAEENASGVVESDFQQAEEELGGNGSIAGQVHDDLRVPLAGVRTSVIGTDHFTSSDARGRFSFATLPPRTYTLRFELEDYRVLESPVEVRPDQTNRIDVTLFLSVERPLGLRPHAHPNWDKTGVYLAMDHDVRPTCTVESAAVALALFMSACELSTEFTLPSKDFNTVWPGTYELEVSFTWSTEDTKVSRLGLLVQGNDDLNSYSHYVTTGDSLRGYRGNWSEYYPRGPGEPFHVQSAWEMQDSGHQRFSTWRFAYFPAPADLPGAVESYQQNLWSLEELPPVHVRITLRKGVVPLEPPHPDHWDGSNVLTLLSGENRNPSSCGAQVEAPESDWGASTRVVPPETLWLEATMELSRPSPTDWVLRYRTADIPPDSDTKKSATSDDDQTTVTWRIPVDGDEPDDVYGKRSLWRFWTTAADYQALCMDYTNSQLQHITGSLTIVAHRDAMPS